MDVGTPNRALPVIPMSLRRDHQPARGTYLRAKCDSKKRSDPHENPPDPRHTEVSPCGFRHRNHPACCSRRRICLHGREAPQAAGRCRPSPGFNGDCARPPRSPQCARPSPASDIGGSDLGENDSGEDLYASQEKGCDCAHVSRRRHPKRRPLNGQACAHLLVASDVARGDGGGARTCKVAVPPRLGDARPHAEGASPCPAASCPAIAR
jgi:hypothetical protein